MELVYLWVEDYKNIKKQGFNFSPHFKCHYDETTKKLTIDENKDYVSIFPKNINVTAIVGENGSGKSSILRSLIEANDVFFSIFQTVKHQFIMCYINLSDKNEKKILVTNINIDNKTEFALVGSISHGSENYHLYPFELIYYDNSLTYFKRYWNNRLLAKLNMRPASTYQN